MNSWSPVPKRVEDLEKQLEKIRKKTEEGVQLLLDDAEGKVDIMKKDLEHLRTELTISMQYSEHNTKQLSAVMYVTHNYSGDDKDILFAIVRHVVANDGLLTQSILDEIKEAQKKEMKTLFQDQLVLKQYLQSLYRQYNTLLKKEDLSDNEKSDNANIVKSLEEFVPEIFTQSHSHEL